MGPEMYAEAVELITMAVDKHATSKNYEAAATMVKVRFVFLCLLCKVPRQHYHLLPPSHPYVQSCTSHAAPFISAHSCILKTEHVRQEIWKLLARCDWGRLRLRGDASATVHYICFLRDVGRAMLQNVRVID